MFLLGENVCCVCIISPIIWQTMRKYQAQFPSWGKDGSRIALKLVNLTKHDIVIRLED